MAAFFTAPGNLAIALASVIVVGHDRAMTSQGNDAPEERSYTLAEVAGLMIESGHPCTIGALREACAAGTLKSHKKRGVQLVKHSDLQSYLEAQNGGADAGALEAAPVRDETQPEDGNDGSSAENSNGWIHPASGAHDPAAMPAPIADDGEEGGDRGAAENLIEESTLPDSMRIRCELELTEDGEKRRHGRFQCWHADGKLAAEGTYLHGVPDGEWRQWHPNGEKLNASSYKNGLLSGLWTAWDDTGSKLQEGHYVDGQAQGTWTEYYENGTVWRTCTFEKGEISGPQSYFDSQGKPLGDEFGMQDGGL